MTGGGEPRRALVLGGSGAIGSAVVRGLREAGLDVTFTYRSSGDVARALADATGARAVAADLRDPGAVRAAVAEVGEPGPAVLVHCAATSRWVDLGGCSDHDWDQAHAVNLRAPFVAVQAAAPALRAAAGSVVLVGALDRSQSVPSPAHFAASQGGLSALAMALARELGPDGVRVNLVAVGLLDAGLSRQLAPRLIADYQKFSALRRLGRPDEVAAAVVWLATDNTYMNGKVLPVNGGI